MYVDLFISLLFSNCHQLVPEIICDFICIGLERWSGLGEHMDEYWRSTLVGEGLTTTFPMVSLVIAVNVTAIIMTARTSCFSGECAPGF